MSHHESMVKSTHDVIRQLQLQSVWTFDDLHYSDASPEFIHRIQHEVKHMGVCGSQFVLTNSSDENVNVYLDDSPQLYLQLNIQDRQMNCSIVL